MQGHVENDGLRAARGDLEVPGERPRREAGLVADLRARAGTSPFRRKSEIGPGVECGRTGLRGSGDRLDRARRR